MINIDLKLFATLTEFLPENSENYQVRDNITIDKLLFKLGIKKDQAAIIFINGIKKSHDTPLKQGDRVGIFPPVGGG